MAKNIGSMALAMPTIPAANVHRMGSTDDQQIILGRTILPATAGKRLNLSSYGTRFGVHVDPHHFTVLANRQTLQ